MHSCVHYSNMATEKLQLSAEEWKKIEELAARA
jgi:hypothetical protein